MFVNTIIELILRRVSMLDKIALTILIIGGLNWGSIGVFQFDAVSWLFGGMGAVLSRIIFVLVGLAAIWCISILFRDNTESSDERTVHRSAS